MSASKIQEADEERPSVARETPEASPNHAGSLEYDVNESEAQEVNERGQDSSWWAKYWKNVVAYVIGAVVGFVLVSWLTGMVDLLPETEEED